MTIAELIGRLSRYDRSLPVWIHDGQGDFLEITFVEMIGGDDRSIEQLAVVLDGNELVS